MQSSFPRLSPTCLATTGILLAALLVSPVSGAPSATPSDELANVPLRDTRWVLQSVEGTPVVAAAKEASTAQLVLRARSQHVEGSTGCNKVRGRYTQRGTELAVKALATTRMACAAELMAQEQALLKVLASTDSYRIEGRTLSLMQADVVKVTFEAAAPRKAR